ncbi:uncharacterized protein MICPUCDRAFT_35318 [Micromonas pusilla CCMP1545]|uniref:Predicted protein n=1 Tax=Micromonas pusilla (strain CCMP1545) TaxID=564608 RepID=C1N0Y3_MICPC|nr:uncharacterized protein MICPUCDRAFT_35318 [Micromonas pusilla CCMP1545]EEH54345.1 predicted protein [Micromonas pusilla CCMP1545]|eukprot:XP_003061715.1 predicted protein [Micromonas pusilla CCMP1545]
MPPKKPLVDQSVLANLKVLQKDDPDVEEILGSASHVTLYGFDLDAKAWSRKNVEGTLFVVRRRAVPSFQFVVLNRLSTENCRENLLGEFEFELSPPYLLYRSESEVNGIWFYRQEECDAMSALFDQITTAFAREPAGVSSVDDTAATLHRLGIGGAPAAAAAPAPAPAQSDNVAALFAGTLGQGGGAPPGYGGAAPAPMAEPPVASVVAKPRREKTATPAPVATSAAAPDSPAAASGGGGGGLNRESVRAAMYKLVSNDNFVDLMVKELKKAM